MRLILLILFLALTAEGSAFGFFRDLFGKRQGEDERRGVYYQVQKGDTLYSLSKKFDVPIDRIRRANHLRNNNLPTARIFIPGAKEVAQKPAVSPTAKKPAVITVKPVTRPVPVIKEVQKKPSPPKAVTQVKSREFKFLWPVKNPVLTKNGLFGNQNDGTTNSGIRISVPMKEPVMASRDGKVVYTGTMPGYGETLILDHLDNYFSVYSHMDSIRNLKAGFTVTAGSIIGYAGKSVKSMPPPCTSKSVNSTRQSIHCPCSILPDLPCDRLNSAVMEYRHGPLPEVSQPFNIVLDDSNWPHRVPLFRQIFATINPRFVPLIPDLCTDELFSIAERDFLKRIHNLLHSHGLGHISVSLDPDFRSKMIRK